MDDGFILIFSDILFNESILKSVLGSKGDIVLVVDDSYRYHKHELDKKPDMVIAVGGGSVIDSAKAIKALSYQPDDPILYIKGERNLVYWSKRCVRKEMHDSRRR
jgi:choline kinase